MGTVTVHEATDDFGAPRRILDGMDESMQVGRGQAAQGDVRPLYEGILADPAYRRAARGYRLSR